MQSNLRPRVVQSFKTRRHPRLLLTKNMTIFLFVEFVYRIAIVTFVCKRTKMMYNAKRHDDPWYIWTMNNWNKFEFDRNLIQYMKKKKKIKKQKQKLKIKLFGVGIILYETRIYRIIARVYLIAPFSIHNITSFIKMSQKKEKKKKQARAHHCGTRTVSRWKPSFISVSFSLLAVCLLFSAFLLHSQRYSPLLAPAPAFLCMPISNWEHHPKVSKTVCLYSIERGEVKKPQLVFHTDMCRIRYDNVFVCRWCQQFR